MGRRGRDGERPEEAREVKAAPGFAPIAVPVAFDREVDAASFRRLRRAQYEELARGLKVGYVKFNARGLCLMQHAAFTFLLDSRDAPALQETSS